MTDVTVTDTANHVSMDVTDNGKTLSISFTRFDPVPVSMTITVPRKSSEAALRGFITDIYVNEDVLVNLLKEAIDRL